MEITIKEMIDQFNHLVKTEQTTVDKKLTALRRDFETEVTKISKRLTRLGEAVAIFADECSKNPNDSKLKPEKHKNIMELLNQ